MSELSKRCARCRTTERVTPNNIAQALGSGGLPVYATPCMITLMEYTAMESVKPYLPTGSSTVGTRIDVKHLSATPVGMTDSLRNGARRDRPAQARLLLPRL